MISLSFVVTALNEEALIARCIRSIRSEAPGAPIILVDNGSTDRTVEVAMSLPGITVFHEPRRGLSQARQTGLYNTKTKWVAFIDADNELPDGWLLAAIDALRQSKWSSKPTVAASGPLIYKDLFTFSRSVVTTFYCLGRVAHTILPMMQGGNFIVDRLAMIRAGGFDTSVTFYGEDTAAAKRLTKFGKVKFDLDLVCFSSARRFAAEGLMKVGARYTMNYIWYWVAGRPWTINHADHRQEAA
jgi:glycosyltransferase involved in cell wall biosynthesis